jgi:hypothetical protein
MRVLSGFKKPLSSMALQRLIGHKRYEPVWLMLHKLRIAMGESTGKVLLTGTVEMDEGFVEAVRSKQERLAEKERLAPVKRGRGSRKQAMVLVAVESEPVKVEDVKKHKPARIVGNLRMQVIDDGSSDSIDYEAKKMVRKDSVVETDGWRGYKGLKKRVAYHKVTKIGDKKEASKLFPWVHTAIGNLKRQLNGVHHSIGKEYLQNYLNEFCFKFNRRYLTPGQMVESMVRLSASVK